ncbi:hydroxysteroid dehydrogenase-like protein 2 isoform X2 [Apis mellifera]|uniref:Hydroxysteroid dehydrogenase-like protein 2 n=1 Tax=Apis mellifera TaxID=7460 RepID=A0A7M7GL00_APIME|nr:hydroxysteroid dehydrogenase-like protein 2 isoform X2 [Apis mellifera]|eukprot:XP_006558715.1 hydroxysteroid dehydrogenase-like protein 2 isoform X2 [Apis mellifera]
MINTGKLAGRTIFITGASRGIGKSIALKAAKDGANIVIAAKTAEPHPKLPGTIYTTAKEIEEIGGKALPCVVDVRFETNIISAVENAVNKFGGIDIVINNASAIHLIDTLSTEMKKYDLMNNINTRGTFLVSKACLPYLKKSSNPHIVNISPPLNLKPIWFKNHIAYTISKYGMSMCAFGMAEEFKNDGIAINTVWPKTAIATAAFEMLVNESNDYARKPEIMADAVYALICKDSKSITGKFLIDEEILRNEGITDFTDYACNPDESSDKINVLNKIFQKDINDVNNKSNEKIAQIFTVIQANLNHELVNKIGAIFQFNVKGNEAGTWFLDLKTGDGVAGKGKPNQSPDATLTMDSENFFAMFSGKLKPASAFLMGKLKISGNLQKAMKLEKLMQNLKSKL